MIRKLLPVLVGISFFSSVFATLTNSWTVTTPLNIARFYHTATEMADGKVLIVGGYNSDYGTLGNAEIFDPKSGTWTATPPMKDIHNKHAATLLEDGGVLVTGGRINSMTNIASTTAEIFANGAWKLVNSMNVGRSDHTATLLADGRVLIAGGRDKDGNAIKQAEIFDPVAGTWTVVKSMNFARFKQTAILLPNGLVLVSGGQTCDSAYCSIKNAELYDVTKDTWTNTGSLNFERASFTTTQISPEIVLAAGGKNTTDGNPIVNVEQYNITSGQWTNLPSMKTPRAELTANILLDKQLLFAGGSTISNNTEIFNSTSTLWANTTEGLNQPRIGHTGTLLSKTTGQVLVVGGHVGDYVSLSSAELYYGGSALKTIVITGGSDNVTSGNQTPAYIATGYDTYGNKVFDIPITWNAISGTGTATINNGTGVAIGGKDGNVTISATSGDIFANTTLNVIGYGPLTSIDLTGGSPSVVSGNKTLPYIATGYDPFNNKVPNLTFIWAAGATNDTGTASIDSATGIATGVNAGLVTIKAMTGSLTGTTTLNVTAAPFIPTNNVIQPPSSSSAWIIPTVVVPVVAAVAVAVGVYFYKKAKSVEKNALEQIAMSNPGDIVESIVDFEKGVMKNIYEKSIK